MAELTASRDTPAEKWPTVAVVGIGFIGLPLAMAYARAGCRVIGVDVNAPYVARLMKGETDSVESCEGKPLSAHLREALDRDLFTATTDVAAAARAARVFIVTVGIPLVNGMPFYDSLDNATEAIARVVRPGDLILYRSTHVPGTVRERLIPIIERSSPYRVGADIHVAYAPERVAEGRAMEEFQTVDVLVGGVNETSVAHAMDVLRIVNRAQFHETSIEMAETVKVVENAQRDVNIAMMQEIAQFAQAMGLRTSELVNLANTHPRVKVLVPGAGVGGYCIPNAYYYLQLKAEPLKVSLPILATARKTNDFVPTAIANRIERRLNWQGTDWKNVPIAVLGLAMKNFSNDDRLSPSLALVEELGRRGARVKAFDPLIPAQRYSFGAQSLEECLADAQIVVIAVKQADWDRKSTTDIASLAPACKLIFDACEALTVAAGETLPVLKV